MTLPGRGCAGVMLAIASLALASVPALRPSPPAGPSASFTLGMQVVYDWDRDHCPKFPAMPPPRCVPDIQPGCDGDNVDSMPRAWADLVRGGYRMLGNVATDQGPSRPQVGPRLDALRHSCSPYTTVVPPDPEMSHMGGDVWVEAPFVLNRTHVYALTHVDQYNATIHWAHNASLPLHYTGTNKYSAVTLYASSDGGGSFRPARPEPGHLVAASPYDNRDGHLGRGLGFGMPSSVFRDPKDGMFYTMLLTNWGRDVLAQKGGQCLLRTSDITDPGSWRAYGGASCSTWSDRPFSDFS